MELPPSKPFIHLSPFAPGSPTKQGGKLSPINSPTPVASGLILPSKPKKKTKTQLVPLSEVETLAFLKRLRIFFKLKGWDYTEKEGRWALLIQESIVSGVPIWQILVDGLILSGDNMTKDELVTAALRFDSALAKGQDLASSPLLDQYDSIDLLMYLIILSAGKISMIDFAKINPDSSTGAYKIDSNKQWSIISLDMNNVFVCQYKMAYFYGPTTMSQLGNFLNAPVAGKIPMTPDSGGQFSDYIDLFNEVVNKLDIPCYQFSIKLLSQLKGHFLDGVIMIPNTTRSYSVDRTTMSLFSSFFAANFINGERNGQSIVQFNPFYEAYLVEYIKYLDGDKHSLLDLSDFIGNFNFAVYIQDRLLTLNLLRLFFDNLDAIDMTSEQKEQILEQINVFLNTLSK